MVPLALVTIALPHCLGLSYWLYQLVLSWYLHQPESHQLSFNNLSQFVRDTRTHTSDPGDTWVRWISGKTLQAIAPVNFFDYLYNCTIVLCGTFCRQWTLGKTLLWERYLQTFYHPSSLSHACGRSTTINPLTSHPIWPTRSKFDQQFSVSW